MKKIILIILLHASLHASLFKHVGTINQPTDGTIYLQPNEGLIGFFEQTDGTINIWHVERQQFRKYISLKDIAKYNQSLWIECRHKEYGDYLSYGPFWQTSSMHEPLNIEWPRPDDPFCEKGNISIINWKTRALFEIPWAKEKYCALIDEAPYFVSLSDNKAMMIRDYRGKVMDKISFPEDPKGDVLRLFSYKNADRIILVAVFAQMTFLFEKT